MSKQRTRGSGLARARAALNSAFTVPLLLGALSAAAQTVNIEHWPNGSIDLSTGWRAHDGDNPAYAQSDYDDSAWSSASLAASGEVQSGWRWYRLRVQPSQRHQPLALLVMASEGTYELYVDGHRSPGARIRSALLLTYPREHLLPISGKGPLELALRTFVPRNYASTRTSSLQAVFLGTHSAIESKRRELESARMYGIGSSIAINLFIILIGIGALALYRAQRGHREYMWLGLFLIPLAVGNLAFQLHWNRVAPISANFLLADPLLYVFAVMQIEFTFSFAGRKVTRGWRIYEAVLLSPLVLVLPVWTGSFDYGIRNLIEACVFVPATLSLPIVLFAWYRRGNREAGWLILPSVLPAATIALLDVGTFLSRLLGWKRAAFMTGDVPLLPFPLPFEDLGNLLFVLAIGVVIFLRFTRISREQARGAAELDAAREIQRQLVPASLP